MCLILAAWRCRADCPLVFAANRDEFHARPTARAAWWEDPPGILAGRDLVGGGTWFGVDRGGRWAAVTNIRNPAALRASGRSRGLLVRDYLAGAESPLAYLRRVAARADAYAPFNLLVGDPQTLAYFGRGNGPPRILPPGLYGLSNAALNTPWPKVEDGKRALAELLEQGCPAADDLYGLLADRTPAAEERLPDTGVGLERERLLSPRFICSADYGTRSSTLLRLDEDGRVRFGERTFASTGACRGKVRETFRACP